MKTGYWINRFRFRNRSFVKRKISAFLFILPAVALFALFVWYPIILGFIMSFQRIDNILKPAVWVGFDNYKFIFSDNDFMKSILSSSKFTIASIICFPFGIILAIAINEFSGFKKLFRTVFYIPQLFPAVAVYALWTYFFSQGDGAFNVILNQLHLPSLPWFGSRNVVFVALQIMTLWFETGGGILLYSAAIEGINAELYEAAEIDGAGWLSRAWHITLPEMQVIIIILLLQTVIGKMQIFDMPYIMTGGGPNNATLTPVMYIYNNAFQYMNFGVASAMSVVLFVVLIGFSAAYFKRSRAE